MDLEIPPKKELLVYCPMSKRQEELYRATVDRSIALILGLEVLVAVNFVFNFLEIHF